MKYKTLTLVILIGFYFALKYYIPYGIFITYPITLLVTFLHEFGHSFFAVITGGSALGIQINSNGSGFAITSGGITNIVLMGGYIGSAIFGNILLYFGFKEKETSKKIIYLLSLSMFLTSILLFNSIDSSIILVIGSIILFLIARYINFQNIILQFLGISTILYIIEDFNVGPSSDLSKFSTVLPTSIRMIVWLVIVIFITLYNFKLIGKIKVKE